MRNIFGEWRPDLPPHLHDGLAIARNCFAAPNGYRPLKAFAPIAAPLTDFSGGAAYVSSDGTASLLGGTGTGLWLYSGSWTSKIGSLVAGRRWRFTQFADTVIAVHGGAPIKFNLLSQAAAPLGGSPPKADMCATVREFVVLAGDPDGQQTIAWSDQGLPEIWSGLNQSGAQPLFAGGEITGLVGGEYGIVLQRNSVKRMVYTGDPATVFQFDEIGANVGCIAKGSVAQHGRMVFFLSERGFAVCDGNAVTFIGNEKVDRTFFAAHTRADLDRLWSGVDPRNSLVFWAMPGNPGRLWIYNWVLDRWTDASIDLLGIFDGRTANISIDGLDALYPGGIDTVPGSLDDAAYQGGNPLLMIVRPDGAIGTLAGSNLVVSLTTPWIEPIPGQYARINSSRPIGDAATGVSIAIDTRAKIGDGAVETARSDMRSSGDIPIRCSGRFARISLTIADPAFSFVQAVELEFAPGGRR